MHFLNTLAAVAAALVVGVDAAAHGLHGRNHTGIARRQEWSKWTWYNTETGNAGACGRHIKNTEFVVALNTAQYNEKKHCFKKIVLSYGGKTAEATIGDACPTCPYNGLDLSRDLFNYFADLGMGVIDKGNSWHFAGEGPAPPPPPPPKPSTTKKEPIWTPPPPPPPKPSTTKKEPEWTPPPPPPPPPSPTSSKPKEAKSSSSKAPPPEPTPTVTEEKASTPTPEPTTTSTDTARTEAPTATAAAPSGNIQAINDLVIRLGGLIIGGARAD